MLILFRVRLIFSQAVLGFCMRTFPSLLARVSNVMTCRSRVYWRLSMLPCWCVTIRVSHSRIFFWKLRTQAIAGERLVLYVRTCIFGTLLRRIPSFVHKLSLIAKILTPRSRSMMYNTKVPSASKCCCWLKQFYRLPWYRFWLFAT